MVNVRKLCIDYAADSFSILYVTVSVVDIDRKISFNGQQRDKITVGHPLQD